MKKVIITAGLALLFGCVFAQQTASDYIVKTKNAKKTLVAVEQANEEATQEAEDVKAHDFISENFKFYSLCDWKEGMKFMVMPEKYDLVVKTFHDGVTGKEVSSVSLRNKIMVYKGHTVGADGRVLVHFLCQDNNKI